MHIYCPGKVAILRTRARARDWIKTPLTFSKCNLIWLAKHYGRYLAGVRRLVGR
jgi:hypothetical protein